MKIAVINESFLEEGHYDVLRKLGDLSISLGSHNEDEAIELIKDADIVIGDMFETQFTNKVLDGAKNLKLLAINSTGFDLVDVQYARSKGISVANIKGFCTDSVAEHTIALIFALARRIPQSHQAMHPVPFQVDPGNPTEVKWRGVELRGKTLGIIGYGMIGARVAEIAKAMGMKVIAWNRSEVSAGDIDFIELEELLKASDFVSLHTAFADELRDMINADTLEIMKSTAYLINTGRSELVSEEALVSALKSGKIAGAALDLIRWSADNELLSLESVITTPHIAWYSDQSTKNLASILTKNVEGFVKGAPQNIVN